MVRIFFALTILVYGLFPQGDAHAQASLDLRGNVGGSGIPGGSILLGFDSATCANSIEGAIRYNSSASCAEFCDGTNWICPKSGSETGNALPDSLENWPDGTNDVPPDQWTEEIGSTVTNGPDRSTLSVTDGSYSMFIRVDDESHTMAKAYNISGLGYTSIQIDYNIVAISPFGDLEFMAFDEFQAEFGGGARITSAGAGTAVIDLTNHDEGRPASDLDTIVLQIQFDGYDFSNTGQFLEAYIDNIRGVN